MSDCIFCRIASGSLQSDIVHRDENTVAFRDINPQAPVHIVVIPVKHIGGVEKAADPGVFAEIFAAINAIISKDTSGAFSNGFRVVANSGSAGGQTVDHLHFHLLAGRQMFWPPG